MKCSEIFKIIEEKAPLLYAKDWDNSGFCVGDAECEVDTIMLALDSSMEVINEAVSKKAQLLITHHPLIFSPLKRITTDNFMGKKIYTVIKNNLNCYSAHTNMDVAVMAKMASDMIGLTDTKPLEADALNEKEGIGKAGNLKKEMQIEELAEYVKTQFNMDSIKYTSGFEKSIKRVAISPGAGKSMIKYALKEKVDVLITGDIDHHALLDAREQGLAIIDGGHFSTEYFVVRYMHECLYMEFEKYKAKGEKVPNIIIAKEKNPYITKI